MASVNITISASVSYDTTVSVTSNVKVPEIEDSMTTPQTIDALEEALATRLAEARREIATQFATKRAQAVAKQRETEQPF